MKWYICKCGNQRLLSKQADIELTICPLCERIGCWIEDEELDND